LSPEFDEVKPVIAKLMKVAVPTDDGIHIHNDMKSCGFNVFTVEHGEMTAEEFRWNRTMENVFKEEVFAGIIKDCTVILVNGTISDTAGTLNGKQVVPVKGNIIASVIWNYLAEVSRKEANTCCCP